MKHHNMDNRANQMIAFTLGCLGRLGADEISLSLVRERKNHAPPQRKWVRNITHSFSLSLVDSKRLTLKKYRIKKKEKLNKQYYYRDKEERTNEETKTSICEHERNKINLTRIENDSGPTTTTPNRFD